MRKAIVMNTGITEHKGKESLIHENIVFFIFVKLSVSRF